MSSQQDGDREPDPTVKGDIAIIGMACLFPGAPDLDTYWYNIMSKVDAITDPPPEAWDAETFYDPESTANDRVYCKRGGFIGPLAYFDPLEHGIMPRAIEGGEPDQWLALQVAYDALADAGYGEDTLTRAQRHSTAVIIGRGTYLNRGNTTHFQHGSLVEQTMGILKTLHPEFSEDALQAIRQELKASLPPFNPDTVPSLIPNIVAGRIANRLDLMGPSYTVDAACASSLVAADMAVRGLRSGEYNMALVGGAHVVTPVPIAMLFCQLGALSRTERIRPFDKDADGTILGEGIGMVVLKRREDAERDGDRIYAVIKGAGLSSDGRGQSVMAPRLEGEVLALRRAYEQAGISPGTIELIEAHGTATTVGDAQEIEALTQVLGARGGALPTCALGSVKSMIGHLMPAAGIAGLIKTALALYHRILPPTLNVDEPNPRLQAERSQFYVNTEPRPWIHGDPGTPRRAGINAFGFGGINAHVILEEHPDADDVASPGRQLHWDTEVCVLSAETRAGLIQRAQQVLDFLQNDRQVQLKDLAYTINVPFGKGPCRLSIVASSIEDLVSKLDRALERLSDPNCNKIRDVQGIYFFEQRLAESGKLAFLFPGEGSQYPNMLAGLCLHFPEVRKRFDLLDRLFAGRSRDHVPSDFLFPRPVFSEHDPSAAQSKLWQMEGAIESVLTANYALFTILHHLEVQPNALLGHSTGEYSALLTSGMIDVADEKRLGEFTAELHQAYQQAAALGETPRVTLAAVSAGSEATSAITGQIDGEILVAMDNCPHQTVILGKEKTIDQAIEQLHHRGMICERLPFDRPYHTHLFEAFVEPLREFFDRWLTSAPRLPTYSCTTKSRFTDDLAQARKVAVEHWVRPVAFSETIESMYADGVRIFVEVGPRGNLSAFVNDILRGRPHLAVPANVMSRSGIAQLNHLVGLLAAHGVTMQLDYLYARRSPHRLALDRPEEAGDTRPSYRIKVATGWPPMSLSDETASRLRGQIQVAMLDSQSLPANLDGAVAPTRREPIAQTAAAAPAGHELAAQTVGKDAPQSPSPVSPSAPPPPPSGAAQVVSAHLQVMEQFLSAQQEIMQAYLTGHTPASPAVVPVPQEASAPVSSQVSQATVPSTTVAGQAGSPAASALPSDEDQPTSAETASLDEMAIGDILLHLVSERTGYPVEMLDLNRDLEAELGIDSIKRVEILGSFQQQTGLLREEDMEALSAGRTLQEVIDLLVARDESPADPEPTSSSDALPKVSPLPFIGKVVSLVPGEELIALRTVDLDEDLFLLEHTLGREISVFDPQLKGLPVMPLTVSMEMLAEAAAVLISDRRLIGMRNVRAYRWIILEEKALTLSLTARRDLSTSGHEVHVQIHEVGAAGEPLGPAATPIIEGTMVFGGAYPEPPVAGDFELQEEHPSKWVPERLYEESRMFHGPAFRGVVSMDRLGADGAEATLQVLPASGLFRSDPDPSFVTDPVLLDQLGQVVGFWGLERLETSRVMFPFRLEALHLYGPNPSTSDQLKCQARIALIGGRVRSDLAVFGPEGGIRLRIEGWEDQRFDLPDPFFRFVFSSPRERVLSEPWSTPTLSLPQGFHARRLSLEGYPDGFFSASSGIWRRVLAHAVLSRRERELWLGLRTPAPRRLEWLLGRVAAKDAVRQYLKQHYDLLLCPADVEILPDEHGRPVVQDLAGVASVPIVSLSHAKGVAVAIVGDSSAADGIGIDIEPVGRLVPEAGGLAFTPGEQALLSSLTVPDRDGWPLRLWCAKEAVAKALGQGFVGGPRAVVVESLDTDTGFVHVHLAGEMARRFSATNGDPIAAYTARDHDLIVATSVHVHPTGVHPQGHRA